MLTWFTASTSSLSSTVFIMSVMLRTSVATIIGDAMMAHIENSVTYSSSVCPGQCACVKFVSVSPLQPCPPVIRKSLYAQLKGPDMPMLPALVAIAFTVDDHSSWWSPVMRQLFDTCATYAGGGWLYPRHLKYEYNVII